ncbi:PTS glucitol/sorbitol transporter subunit IIB [Propionibacterium australiense]|uniref:PTS sorbitol transporter subunit IIB n=1 Tax=Propionibacterium australiense TaxID=119981 RepID=A0A383S6G7_9ACTN|nr:PTS glucitol/sorbitol transporter subunit IIB [Propionibacterium australiense]RLP10089.1 PTS sorbitol transporter subunit IIB [Propionibacterium australiense]RLP11372.1 PTS sorbitol transporter subunit IIB [Propionibacterium australiense]SYZ33014.1 protein-Npi-phosphohistidine-sugar phosphotransferase [Propionibacterium australiense]VEH92241.1 Glucitol/sorbitol-specific phosphotransferase enzyme IIB component [Propionibacterium australiense]
MSYRSVKVVKGNGGWGNDMILTPTDEKKIVMSVTGGGIHPVAARIAELSGAEAVDGFTNSVEDDKVLAAVINCGGTARIGVYPKKRINTIDIYPGSPTGPLAKYITEDIFVSAVGLDQISLADAEAVDAAAAAAAARADEAPAQAETERPKTVSQQQADKGGFMSVIVKFGNAVGYVINTLLSSGRQALDIILKTVLPFMAYVGLLMGIVNYTGISDLIATAVTPLAGNPIGLILLGVIVALPFLSPVLGPGAAIAQVVGVLMGQQIGAGSLPVQYALPTLFAIDGQVGCDFVPVGLSLGEAQPETISVGVSAVLFTRLVTSPVAVIIAYLTSFLLI